MIIDYCPACGSDDLDEYMNGEAHCNECGHVYNEEEELDQDTHIRLEEALGIVRRAVPKLLDEKFKIEHDKTTTE